MALLEVIGNIMTVMNKVTSCNLYLCANNYSNDGEGHMHYIIIT